MLKKILFLVLLLLNFSYVYSVATINYDVSDFNSPIFNYYCTPLPALVSTTSNTLASSVPTSCVGVYSLLSLNGDFRVQAIFSGTEDINSFSYRQTDMIPNAQTCNIENLAFDVDSFNATFNANLKPFANTNYNSLVQYFPNVMDQNYHMKTFAFLRVEDLDNPGTFKYFTPDSTEGNYTYNTQTYNIVDFNATTRNQLNNEFTYLSSLENNLGLVTGNFPYVLTTPLLENYSFSSAQNNLDILCNNLNEFCSYDVTLVTVPIDGKCDFDSTEPLGLFSPEYEVSRVSDVFSQEKLTVTYNFSSGVVESNSTGNWISLSDSLSGFDLISDVSYSKGFAEGVSITLRTYPNDGFIINFSTCENFEVFERRRFQECTFIFNSSTENQSIQFIPFDSDEDSVPDYIDKCLGESGLPELAGCSDVNSLGNENIYYEQIGDCGNPFFANYFSGSSQLTCPFSSSISFFQDINLVNDGNILGHLFLGLNPFGDVYPLLIGGVELNPENFNYYSGDYICRDFLNKYQGHCRLSAKANYSEHSYFDKYRNLELRQRKIGGSNVTFLAPFDSPVRYADSVIVDIGTDEVFFENQNGSLEELNLTSFSTTVDVVKQGDSRELEFNENDLALALTNIAYFLDSEEVENKVDSVISTMDGLDISQSITSISSRNPFTKRKELTTSRITLNVSNISDSKNRISIYYIIPKESALDYSQITILSEPSGPGVQSFVTDKDPIIGWYFEDPGDSEVIIIEVPGDSDGGIIIVSEDPVLYNSGDLVVRYREDSCASDEQLLFELDSLVDSKVHLPGEDTNFKVCLAHLIDDLSLGGTNTIDLFSILPDHNVSTTFPGGDLIQVSENSGKYWSTLVQKDNPGSYSCIGSFDNFIDSYFGDCNYNEDNRLWIKLEEDTSPPVVSTYFPTLGNAIQLEILVEDLESGVDWSTVKYCIDSGNSCVPSTSYVDGQKLFISCPGTIGCVKYLRVQASDFQGNADVYSEQLRLLDKGSSCQSDCTAKPSPNRYLAECSGLNGCFYYEYDLNNLFDSGTYVANQCDFNIVGAWVTFNATHDIQCPRGPFRLSKFTQEEVDITSNVCGLIRTTEYPIIINGESMIMNVVSCIK